MIMLLLIFWLNFTITVKVFILKTMHMIYGGQVLSLVLMSVKLLIT